MSESRMNKPQTEFDKIVDALCKLRNCNELSRVWRQGKKPTTIRLARTRAGINEKTVYFRRSVNIPLPNFRRVITEPILDLSPVARQHLRNVTDRHSMLLAQANRIQPHLPSGSKVAGVFVFHLSCSKIRAKKLHRLLGQSHIRPTKEFDLVGNKDHSSAGRTLFFYQAQPYVRIPEYRQYRTTEAQDYFAYPICGTITERAVAKLLIRMGPAGFAGTGTTTDLSDK